MIFPESAFHGSGAAHILPGLAAVSDTGTGR